MANAGEKQVNENYAENLGAEQGVENSVLMGIDITGTVVSDIEIKREDKRDFTTIFARLKKSARKRSVSIF